MSVNVPCFIPALVSSEAMLGRYENLSRFTQKKNKCPQPPPSTNLHSQGCKRVEQGLHVTLHLLDTRKMWLTDKIVQ
jgi:hypothetical protein